MRASPEFPVSQSEGLYGYSIIDIGIGKLRNLGYPGLKLTGALLAVVASGAFLVDTLITSNAADLHGLRRSSAERTRFVNNYRGSRSSAELAGILAGVGVMGTASVLQARRAAMQS